MRNIINKTLIKLFIKKDDEAIDIFSRGSLVLLTYFTCAFFKRLLFVVSNTEVTAKNKDHVPTCAVLRTLTRIIKLINPKKVSENRCKIV